MITMLLFACGDVERHPGPSTEGERHAEMMFNRLYMCGDVEHHPGPWADLFLDCAIRTKRKKHHVKVESSVPHARHLVKSSDASQNSSNQGASEFDCLFLSTCPELPSARSAGSAYSQLFAPAAPASVEQLIRKPTPGQVRHQLAGMPSAYLPGVLPETSISAMAADALADALLQDTSEFALRPNDTS